MTARERVTVRQDTGTDVTTGSGAPPPDGPAWAGAPSVRRRAIGWSLVVIVLAGLPGCRARMAPHKPSFLMTYGDAERLMRVLLESDDADARRRAVERLSDSRYFDHDDVGQAIDLAARTDLDDTVRRVAVRSLAQSDRHEVAGMLLALLGAPDERTSTPPAGDQLRWDTVNALIQLVQRMSLGETTLRDIRRTGDRLLEHDPSRDVRLAAARLLGYCPSREGLIVLIGALRHTDFGVVYEAERSLMRLTGQTQNHDHNRWLRWLEATSDPFAERGTLDGELDPPRRSLWPWSRKSS